MASHLWVVGALLLAAGACIAFAVGGPLGVGGGLWLVGFALATLRRGLPRSSSSLFFTEKYAFWSMCALTMAVFITGVLFLLSAGSVSSAREEPARGLGILLLGFSLLMAIPTWSTLKTWRSAKRR